MAFPLVFRLADDPSAQMVIGSDFHPVVPRVGETVSAKFYRDKEAFRVRSVEHILNGEGRSSDIIILLDRISV
jgi:hypothetical protein